MHARRIKLKHANYIATLDEMSSPKQTPVQMEFQSPVNRVGKEPENKNTGDFYVVDPKNNDRPTYDIMMEESEKHMEALREAIKRGVDANGCIILNGKKLTYYGPEFERDESIERKDVEQCQSIIKENMPNKPVEIQLRMRDKVNQDNLLDGLWDVPEKHQPKTYFDNIHLSNFFNV